MRCNVLAGLVVPLFAWSAFAADPVTNSSLTGAVRDPDGKPISGAVVRITGSQGGLTTYAGGQATTGADGCYEIRVYVHNQECDLLGVAVRGKGFVQFDDRYRADIDAPILRRQQSTELNFTLARGAVLAGTIDARPGGLDRLRGTRPADTTHVLKLRGPSFSQIMAVRGSTFEEYVPAGAYSLELVHGDQKLPPARLDNVAAGTRGLKLTAVYPPVDAAVAAKALDALVEDLGRHYSYFAHKKVDWPAAVARHRPKAAAATDLKAFVDALQDLLGELRDGHVWIEWPAERNVPTSLPKPRPINYNRQVTLASLEDPQAIGEFAVVGKTEKDRFAAIVLTRQGAATPNLVGQVVEFIIANREAPGFILDLREATGGNELYAQEIARQFCGADVVYAKSRFRNGPEPGDFGPEYERGLQAATSPFLKPVVCLQGDRSISSGEGFVKMMAALPHVTTVGATTRGSSGNPKPFKLPGLSVRVFYSRWVDLMPDGTPVEDRGIEPDVPVEATVDAYRDGDPTWEKAVEVLRQKVRNAKP